MLEHVAKKYDNYLHIFGSLKLDVSQILFDHTSLLCRRHGSLFDLVERIELKKRFFNEKSGNFEVNNRFGDLSVVCLVFEKEASSTGMLGM